MNRPKVITLSNLYFYRKIINKYQNVKRNLFRLPMMIFYRNVGSILKKINMSISLQLYFHTHNPNVSSYLIVERAQDMRRLFSWFSLEGLQGVNRVFSWIQRGTAGKLPPAGGVLLKGIPVVSFMQSMKRTLVLKSLFSGPEAGSYPQYVGLYPSTQRENVWRDSVFEYKSPTILPKINLSLGKSESFQDRMSLSKPFMNYNSVSGVASNANAKAGRTAFKTDGEDFDFYKQRRIEEEVEEIKRIVVETKGVVEEKSVSNDIQRDIDLRIKRQLDVNRISDQVYQNIERRIRMERERRGL